MYTTSSSSSLGAIIAIIILPIHYTLLHIHRDDISRHQQQPHDTVQLSVWLLSVY